MKPAFVQVLLATAALGMGGCVSLEESAPPVPLLSAIATGGRGTVLEQGRMSYITRCAKCHSVYPIRKYSLADWDDILPKMVAKSKMSPPDAEAVRAYVLAVLRSPPVAPKTGG